MRPELLQQLGHASGASDFTAIAPGQWGGAGQRVSAGDGAEYRVYDKDCAHFPDVRRRTGWMTR